MSGKDDEKPAAGPGRKQQAREERRQRLGAALRRNLQRRKAQARGRTGGESEDTDNGPARG